MTERLELDVNGERRPIDDDPLTPLRTVLGQTLGLRSVREPCAVGACGACTVLVDRRPVKSCLRPVGLVGDGAITTAEGLSNDDRVLAAFVAHDAFQCGFCIPGFVMSVHALLAGELPAGPEAVREALAGNLCRCGSYTLILEAVEDLLWGARSVQASGD
jgi:aerobic-type carbon monoxide dehydrogenase small subunit (CoxS/CutS family)